jgi:hypothetical protein
MKLPDKRDLGRLWSVITLLVGFKMILVTTSAVVSTYLCIHYEVVAEFPLSFVSSAIVFPVVFSIGGAYNRRESALAQYGSMKAHLRCIFFATRDWVDKTDVVSATQRSELLPPPLPPHTYN